MRLNMKSMIWKSTFREIRQSLGRFFAILAIVALGVGFFSGLKVTQKAMVATTEQYWDETAFYDYRLLSEVGFSKEDEEVFREQKEVLAAEGAVSFDIICQEGSGAERVLRAHSITEQVNKPVLTAGRMPQKASECVVDAHMYDASVIGKKIRISEENDTGDAKHFAYREYEVTGVAQSPLYIQFERGNTSVGNGRINGFLYLLPEAFDVDYYTEIYVKFEPDFPLYSEAYDAYIKEKTDAWETLAAQRAQIRYQTVLADTKKELADGKKELAEKKAEAEEKFAEAKKELDDAKEQLDDGERQLAAAKKKLADAPEQLRQKEEELAKAEQTIAEKEMQISQAEIGIGIGYAQGIGAMSDLLNQASEGMFSGETTAFSGGMADDIPADATAQIAEVKQQIADGKAQIAAAKARIADGKKALRAAAEDLEKGKTELRVKEREFNEGKEKYEKGKQEYDENWKTYREEIADAEKQIADGEQALADLKDPQAYVLDRNTNIGYACFESDSGIVDGIADIFPVFFFLVAALVCITTMNRMVEEQRTQIGVLKALGYAERTIMAKYLFYSGSAAVIGCVAGFFGGTFFLPKVIWYAYGMMYQVDALVYVFDWKLAAISLAVSLLCSAGTTWVSCRLELSEAAASLMRPKAPKAGKRVILEYLPFFWKRLKFLQKVSLRNIFRYKKRFFMMIIGISGCTALLVTGYGVKDSVTGIAQQQFQEIQIYDISMTCSREIGTKEQQKLEELKKEGVSEYLFVSDANMDLESDGKIKSVAVITAAPDADITPYLNLHTKAQEAIAYPKKGEAVISNKIAEQFHIRVGDEITLSDADRKTIHAKVSGINRNFIYNYVYLSADTYEEQMGKAPEYKTAYINAAEDADTHLLGMKLMGMDGAASVSVNSDQMDFFANMMSSMDLIVLVIIACAAGLAFIVLYNLTNINITERVREIATIKVLGFYEKETSAYVFRENTLLSFLGALLGLLLGVLLHRFVMSQITVDMVSFDVHIRWESYVYSLGLTMLFTWFVSRMMRKKLDRISMTESLKSVD